MSERRRLFMQMWCNHCATETKTKFEDRVTRIETTCLLCGKAVPPAERLTAAEQQELVNDVRTRILSEQRVTLVQQSRE